FDLPSLPVDGVDSRHLQIEAIKAAFADVYRYVGDARSMTRVRPEDLLDPGYLAKRASLIRQDRATDFAHGTP
ncbi:MAG: gamma-glutamyltransferase, partial [Quisquiliibacterium sp.]